MTTNTAYVEVPCRRCGSPTAEPVLDSRNPPKQGVHRFIEHCVSELAVRLARVEGKDR